MTGLRNDGAGALSPQNNIEAPAPSVAGMGTPDSGDLRRVARGCQPIVNSGADLASLDRRVARPRMSGDEEKDPVASGDCPLKTSVDGFPRLVEVEAVQVERPVGRDRARTKAAVPCGIERGGRVASMLDPLGRRPLRGLRVGCFRPANLRPLFVGGRRRRACLQLPRQRPDCRRNAFPERLFVSAERAHGQRSPSGRAQAPAPWQTCRRPIAELRRPLPRRYRPGCCP